MIYCLACGLSLVSPEVEAFDARIIPREPGTNDPSERKDVLVFIVCDGAKVGDVSPWQN